MSYRLGMISHLLQIYQHSFGLYLILVFDWIGEGPWRINRIPKYALPVLFTRLLRFKEASTMFAFFADYFVLFLPLKSAINYKLLLLCI